MLECFEKLFGEFPFYLDGYKLVESPHLGMEHQTAVAYGNKYRFGYLGRGSSEEGIRFDFIIIHETAHEWWGNSVTSKDIADMWIHESFGAYAEALYVECRWGYEAGLRYQNGKKQDVRNDRPIIGFYNVNHQGSGDMYPKGSLMLNTLRHVVDNDSLWFEIIRGLAQTFRYQTIHTDDIVRFVNQKTGGDYSYLFDQYLKYPNIPELEITVTQQGAKVTARYRWQADVEGFRMPIKVTTSKDKFEFIHPTTEWQTTELRGIHPTEFRVAEDLFFVDVKLSRVYLQEIEKRKSETEKDR
jgi:aminopeptidase N